MDSTGLRADFIAKLKDMSATQLEALEYALKHPGSMERNKWYQEYIKKKSMLVVASTDR